MSLSIFEFFGFSPADHSEAALAFRKTFDCPFVGGQCIKRFRRSGIISGACTVKPVTTGPVICCPNRMYADGYRVLLDVARAAFGPEVRLCRTHADAKGDGCDVYVFGKRWGKELRLPSRGIGGRYFVDWILALVDQSHELQDFVAIELQTMDTTGSYEAEVQAYYHNEKPAGLSQAGINWENVSKRILPQIIYKGNVLRREPLCKKGLFFVCPARVYERIVTRLGGKLEDYHPQAGTITFMWYELSPEVMPGVPRALIPAGRRTTTVEQVADAFSSASNLPPAGVYAQAIAAGLARMAAV